MDRCAACPGINTCVRPSGPPGDYMFIGEAPGRDENKKGEPFVGKTGDEVNRHYLPLAGLRRDQQYFTNAIRCLPTTSGGKLDMKRGADLQLLESCATTHLYREIERIRPKVLVPMGAFACRAINPDIDLELDHGLPCPSRWGIPVFPMYHPAGGMHEPKKMLLIRTDWIRLKWFLAGTLRRVVDPYPDPDYAEVHDVPDWAWEFDPTKPLACDTEFSRRRGPYCLTYSQTPGTGRLIMADDAESLRVFQLALDRHRAPLLFHSWLADRPIVEEMGLRFPEKRIVDTLSWVFHLGNLPQRLKVLSARELGMRMQDFPDLVQPHSRKLIMEFLEDVYTTPYPWARPAEDLVRQKDGSLKVYKPQGLTTKLKRFFTDVAKNPDKDIFSMWDNWEFHHEEIELMCGEWPGMDIRHVPFEEMLFYACRDADATLRLYLRLLVMRARVRKFPQEKWGRDNVTNTEEGVTWQR